MRFSLRLRPPVQVLVIFLCTMAACSGALGWLAWRVLEQDRALEAQRAQERLESAADHALAVLARRLQAVDAYIGATEGVENARPEGVLSVVATDCVVTCLPPGRALFNPRLLTGQDDRGAEFASGESAEYRENNPAKAVEEFRRLAASPDPSVRAGALLRLGRSLRKLGRSEEALSAYARLAQLDGVRTDGLQAELAAREARATIFEEQGASDALRREASLLYAGLMSGRWPLQRDAWEFRLEEVRRWSGSIPWTPRDQERLALAASAEQLYGQWRAGLAPKGRRILKAEGIPVLVVWRTVPGRLEAVAAGGRYLESLWSEALAAGGASGALLDGEGLPVLGSMEKSPHRAFRNTAEAGLSATLAVTRAGAADELIGAATRRRLLLSAMAVLALSILFGSYFILRSMAREHAVARLQADFVSAVSHEFRTPVTSVRQISELLSQGRIPREELPASYELLTRESERLQKLVESVLDFARLEACAFTYRFELLGPAALIGSLVADAREKVAARGYVLEFEQDEPPDRLVRADPNAIGLAFGNLVDNAMKYSPQCRTVWVRMAREEGRLALEVRDRGIGIPVAEQPEVFNKFVRGSEAKAANIKGAGIGLAIARQIVEAHGGEIRLESAPGQGSRFAILLPLETS